ncbi:MAG: flavin oxidoreductase/NADH oxidase, partial [Lachnospiraceae bacterium]|nr:flavin oxidoreductase/NADH oxidase [Lachnospiraceae bacterium]
MAHERFHYKTPEDVKAKAAELGVHLPFAKDASVLAEPVTFDGITLQNRLGIAPMEGADSTPDGSPS